YVLTRRYFETGQKRLLIIGALKRWFRLFGPVFLSVMLSWLFFTFDFYAYGDAAALSHSDWLASFGFAMNHPFETDFFSAIQNSFGETFHDDPKFNPLLWTIHIELIGSYAVFAFAACIRSLKERNDLIALLFIFAVLTTHFIEPNIAPF